MVTEKNPTDTKKASEPAKQEPIKEATKEASSIDPKQAKPVVEYEDLVKTATHFRH